MVAQHNPSQAFQTYVIRILYDLYHKYLHNSRHSYITFAINRWHNLVIKVSINYLFINFYPNLICILDLCCICISAGHLTCVAIWPARGAFNRVRDAAGRNNQQA